MQRRICRVLAASILLLSIAGCGSGKKKEPPSLPPPTRVSIPAPQLELAMREMVSTLAFELPKSRMVQASRTKLVLAIGPVRNASTLFTGDVEAHVERLQSMLLANEAIRNNFIIISTDYADDQHAINSFQSDNHQVLDPMAGNNPASPKKYNPNEIYLLMARAYESDDGSLGLRSVVLSVQVQHVASRSVVLATENAAMLRWDGKSGKWSVVQK